MEEPQYRIRTKRGHSSRLRFWFDPVSKDILNGDADLIYPDELSCDNICMHDLFFPFIEKNFPGRFLFKNELNLMPFENVRNMSEDIRRISSLLLTDYENPVLKRIKLGYSINLLVSEDVYEEKYRDLSPEQEYSAVKNHIRVITDFYKTIADYLDEMISKYGPKGFSAIAISAPV